MKRTQRRDAAVDDSLNSMGQWDFEGQRDLGVSRIGSVMLQRIH